jgi:hypothetical protein
MKDLDLEEDAPGVGRTYGPWVLFGVFGIGVAVGIALLAGSFASQPVGLTGNPVSAGAALKPAFEEKSAPGRKSLREKRQTAGSRAVGKAPSATAGSTGPSSADSVSSSSSSSSSGNRSSSGSVETSSGSGDSSGSGASSGSSGSSGGGSWSGGGGSDDSSESEYEDDSEGDFEYEDDD